MNVKTAISKGVSAVATIGLVGLVLGSSMVSTLSANATDVLLVSVAITASPSTICAGQSSHITWSSTDATSIFIDHGIGSVLPYGALDVSPAQTTTYTITGTNSTGGFGTASATVFVSGSCSTPTPTPTWTPTPVPLSLSCTPSVQYAQSGQMITFSASYNYPTFYVGNLTWQAVGGHPSTGTGSSFWTRFYTSSINQTSVVTVTDGSQTASCTVFVYGPQPTPTWTPTPVPFPTLHCSPSRISASSGEYVTLSATGGNGTYSWTAADGTPSYGYGSTFTTQFSNYTNYQRSYFVNVTSNDWYYGNQTTSCEVRVSRYASPTPTPAPWFSMDHSVRDITRNVQGTSITAHNGDLLQFTTRITIGDRYAEDVHIRDWLPQNVNYVYGSTTVDGSWYQDGIAIGNPNDSLALGGLNPNRTYVVRFDATVDGAANVTLTNSVNVHVRYAGDQNRTSTIRVTGSYVTPTPTWTPTPYPGNGTLALSLTGRNITRGQSGEHSSLVGRGNETLELLLHIRNTSASTLYNVFATDVLPGGLRYVNSSTSINGILTNDALTSFGLNIGTLVSGQEVVIRFNAIIDPAAVPGWGQVDLSDNAQARADGVDTVSAHLPITLGENASIAAISRIKTGPADTILLALLASIVATGLYAIYTNTALFHRRMSMSEIARTVGRKAGMNFIG